MSESVTEELPRHDVFRAQCLEVAVWTRGLLPCPDAETDFASDNRVATLHQAGSDFHTNRAREGCSTSTGQHGQRGSNGCGRNGASGFAEPSLLIGSLFEACDFTHQAATSTRNAMTR